MVTGSIAAAEIEAHSDHIVGKHKMAMSNWKHKVAGAAKLWVKSQSWRYSIFRVVPFDP